MISRHIQLEDRPGQYDYLWTFHLNYRGPKAYDSDNSSFLRLYWPRQFSAKTRELAFENEAVPRMPSTAIAHEDWRWLERHFTLTSSVFIHLTKPSKVQNRSWQKINESSNRMLPRIFDPPMGYYTSWRLRSKII